MQNPANLLPTFQKCDNYADRLAFWEKHQLTERLFYDAVRDEDNLDYVEFLNKKLRCRTWQDAKQLPILTLTPFTNDDARQFVAWALRVRPGLNDSALNEARPFVKWLQQVPFGMNANDKEAQRFFEWRSQVPVGNRYVENFELLSANFLRQYLKQPTVKRRDEYLATARQNASRCVDDKAVNKPALGIIGIDPNLFAQFLDALKEAEPVYVTSYIRLGIVDMDWTIIDTYLFAKAKNEFDVFLENFDPADHQPSPTTKDVQVTKHLGSSKDLAFNSFEDLFINTEYVSKAINILRSVTKENKKLVIDDNGKWTGRKGSLSILIAWVEVLQQRSMFKSTITDARMAELLNNYFPDLKLDTNDASIWRKLTATRSKYHAEFLQVISKP